ncbi:hypothetical protein GCM10011316_23580 [Roseibium aquae]|uniref:Uncharacterized protein n=1 Tax=Roseibium aquae TaxID=1323746 RepID=A0A916TKW7_9HYPH|nr:hypothetical protein [Roseibium aquae]GGB50725.1 hypothetical protein GCM10011316_23580 [Roseibium aquae]
MGERKDRRQDFGAGRVWLRRAAWVAGALCLTALAGCVRPTGDFDRARPSVLHDTVMPQAGEQSARYRGDPVSKFNYTNDEKLLRDRGWTLIRPPWAQDWIGGTVVELSRTRILPEVEGRVPVDLYYVFLSSDKFQSSDARYDRITSDANGDAELVMPFCQVATRVRAADDERLRVLENKQLTTEEIYEGAKARVWENRVMIKWVSQALRYRVKAYSAALDKLEVETPTQDRMWQTTTAIRKLDAQVRIAEAGCETALEVTPEPEIRRSRIFENWSRERPPVQK